MSFKYFNVKNGLTTGNIALHSSNANIQANYFVGNINVTSSANLGAVGNVRITGGENTYVLSTDGTGNLSWVAPSGGQGGSPGGSNTQVQFNDSGNFAGNSGFTFNKVTGVFSALNLSVTGNASAGNLGITGLVSAAGNIQSNATVVTDAITGRTTGVTITASGTDQNINLVPTGVGTVNVGNFIISNVQTPVADSDAATKKYVDDVAQGLNIHDSCQAATPNTLAIVTGGTITYNNGANGVGANLTTTGSFNLIDGVNVQTAGTRILVKNEANAVFNGIYTWSNATVITRASDYNTVPEVEAGDFVFVSGGTLYDNTGWVQTSSPAAIGTAGNVIEFTQFSGAGTYTAGTGLTLTGSQFSISNTTVTPGAYGNGDYNATFTVNQQGQLTAAANVALTPNAANLTGTTLASGVITSSLTSVGTLTALSVTGNANVGNLGTAGLITATGNITGGNIITGGTVNATGNVSGNYFIGNGAFLTGLVAGNSTAIVNGNSNVIVDANSNVRVGIAGTANVLVISSSDANLTGNLQVSGNLTAANIITSGASGNISGANNISANTFTGVLTTNAQPNITSVGTLTSLAVTGNANVSNLNANGISNLGPVGNVRITGGNANFVLSTDGTGNLSWVAQSSGTGASNISNGTSNVNIATANGNITMGVAGNANVVVVTGTGANITGTLNATGNGTFGNIISGGSVTTTGSGGSITGANLVSANSFSATGNITGGNLTTGGLITATGNVTGGNIITGGIVSATGNVTGGNLTTGGNLSVTGVSNLGAVGNVRITGGTANFVLRTDGAGNLSWVAQSTGGGSNISNGTSNVSIAAANGNITMGVAGTANVLVISNSSANLTGNLQVSGNITGGNLNLTGNIVDTTELSIITGANGNINLSPNGTGIVAISSAVSANGNITAGNINAGNLLTANFIAGTLTTAAQGNITSLGTLSSLTATGNITGGNLIGILANGTSNVRIPSANGNVTISSAGNANIVVITGTGANITGTANVTGNLSVGGKSNLGPASNVIITGGTANYVLSTDGAGNLSWVEQSGGGGGGPVVITSDSFTGNGVQTEFTLSVTPANINYTTVNYNGVTLLNTDYSVSGNVLTISSPPANNSSIQVNTISGGGGGGGGSANIAIYDEGNLLTSTVSSIDFVGSGVTATHVGNAVTVTVSGGGGGGGPASVVLDSFTGNGVQTTFTLSTTPQSENYTFVNIDGVSQLKTDYSLSGANIIFDGAPANGALIEVTTVSALSNAQPNFTTRTYTGNGVQTTFAVTNGVTSTGILVTENGILQTPDSDYTVSGANLTFTTAPANAQAIQIRELGTVVATNTVSPARALGYSLIFGG